MSRDEVVGLMSCGCPLRNPIEHRPGCPRYEPPEFDAENREAISKIVMSKPGLTRPQKLARERMVYPSWHDRNMPDTPDDEDSPTEIPDEMILWLVLKGDECNTLGDLQDMLEDVSKVVEKHGWGLRTQGSKEDMRSVLNKENQNG